MNISFIFINFFHYVYTEGDRHGGSEEKFTHILGRKLRSCICVFWGLPVAQMVKNLPAMQETRV